MKLLQGLEKFGLKTKKIDDIFEEEKQEEEKGTTASNEPKEMPKESDYLFVKKTRCPVCDTDFKVKSVKSSKASRMEPDDDLRPRYRNIDTLKYDVVSCPNCGYSALTRYFPHLSPTQIKLIRQEVSDNFTKESNQAEVDNSATTYDTAIDLYKLALFNTIVKKAKTSEKAYVCLKLSWIYRGKIEEMERDTPDDKEGIAALKEEELEFYEQAFEGFQKAIGSELYPMCGMDQNTMDLLMAAMAFRLKKYEIASSFLATIITSNSVSSGVKRRAVDLKQELVAVLHTRR